MIIATKVQGEGNCGEVTIRGKEACECAVKLTLISSSATFSPNLRGDEQKRHMRLGETLRRAADRQRSRFRQAPTVDDALAQGKFTFLSGVIHRTYLKFRLACSQGDHGQLRSCLVEVSRGRSTVSSYSTDDRKDRRERASTSSTYLARLCLSRHKPPYGGQSSVAVRRVPTAWQIALQGSVNTRAQPPGADPHAGWCGRGSGKPGPDFLFVLKYCFAFSTNQVPIRKSPSSKSYPCTLCTADNMCSGAQISSSIPPAARTCDLCMMILKPWS